jgi:hypothetical protein
MAKMEKGSINQENVIWMTKNDQDGISRKDPQYPLILI